MQKKECAFACMTAVFHESHLPTDLTYASLFAASPTPLRQILLSNIEKKNSRITQLLLSPLLNSCLLSSSFVHKAMPAAASSKTASGPKKAAIHPSFKDMVHSAITDMKERTGSTRQQIKKYIESNYKGLNNDTVGGYINKAIKSGVTSGDFTQPKGPSGPVKINRASHGEDKKVVKKTAAKPAAARKISGKKSATSAGKKTAAAAKTKVTTARKVATKKAVKSAGAKKAAVKSPKKKTATKKRTTPKMAPTPIAKKDTAQADKARAARAAKRA
ncbi:linker histone H1 and H5 family-domain-containing protein [Powellomyces hirtus]|nr:linker histone H1 and H5 family-domain-containing protein [Powellomyces hirtus]